MPDPLHGHGGCQTLHLVITLCGGHTKALVYETKVDSRAAQRRHILAATVQLRNHPDIIVSGTHSLLKHTEKCVGTRGGHLEQLPSNRYFSSGK